MPVSHKKSVTLRGNRTSVSLEPEFWVALGDMAAEQGCSLNQLIATIDASNPLTAPDRCEVIAINCESLKRASGIKVKMTDALVLYCCPPNFLDGAKSKMTRAPLMLSK